MTDNLWRNVCKGLCYFGALLFACIAFVEIEAGFNAPPPLPPETCISAGAWLAFIKAVAAATLAFVLGKAGGYIVVPMREETKIDASPLAERIPVNREKIAYHAVVATNEDSSLANYFILAYVREGTKGYARQPEMGKYFDYREAQSKADALNQELGLSRMRAQGMISRWSH